MSRRLYNYCFTVPIHVDKVSVTNPDTNNDDEKSLHTDILCSIMEIEINNHVYSPAGEVTGVYNGAGVTGPFADDNFVLA